MKMNEALHIILVFTVILTPAPENYKVKLDQNFDIQFELILFFFKYVEFEINILINIISKQKESKEERMQLLK